MKQHVFAIFIILHYKNSEDTIKCVNSILKLKDVHNCHIVIWDNGSKNGSYEVLQSYYSREGLVSVFESEKEHPGFSEGNNDAYYKISEFFDADYVIAANNDTEFYQKKFLKILADFDKDKKYYVIGPDILTNKYRSHQAAQIQGNSSPELYRKLYSGYFQNNNQSIANNDGGLFKTYPLTRIVPVFCYDFFKIHYFLIIKRDKKSVDKLIFQKKTNYKCILGGACLIFSAKYLDKFNYVFEEVTSFYFEEDVLQANLNYYNLPYAYYPKLKVGHENSSATKKEYNTVKSMNEFKRNSIIKALEQYSEKYYQLFPNEKNKDI